MEGLGFDIGRDPQSRVQGGGQGSGRRPWDSCRIAGEQRRLCTGWDRGRGVEEEEGMRQSWRASGACPRSGADCSAHGRLG